MASLPVVCETEGADYQVTQSYFRTYEQMQKELRKDAKKYVICGPRLTNDDDGAVGPDTRDPSRRVGTK